MDKFVQKWRADKKSQTVEDKKALPNDYASNVAEICSRKTSGFNYFRNNNAFTLFYFTTSTAPELQTTESIPNKENCNQVSRKSNQGVNVLHSLSKQNAA